MKHYLLAIIFLLGCITSFAQTIRISGKVTGSDGNPISGVTVSVKATKAATTTDKDGFYSISVKSSDSYLVFSSVGFAERTLSPGKNKQLDVVLQTKAVESEEVVVIGYGSTKKKDLTGSVGKVNLADINKAPVRSFDEALAGRNAGLQVASTDGRPGGEINIVIRGNNSITQENSPLYVVDGFPVENPNNNVLNPNDIESIEVLKDASATAIYGARGANGVIIVTTKKGKEGPPVINFNVSYGMQNNIKNMEMMNPYEFVKYQLELDTTSVSSSAFATPKQMYLSNGTTLDDYKNMAATDWQGLVTRRASIANYSLALNGGNKQTKYAISGSILNQDGILINSGYKRYQGRIVLDHNINSKLKVGINANYSNLLQSGISPSLSSFAASNNIMVSVWGSRPVAPNVDGGIEDMFLDPSLDRANDYRVNPVINLENLIRDNRTKNLSVNAYADYAILPSLKFRITGGIVDNLLRQESFNNSKTQYGYPGSQDGVNGSMAYAETSSWVNENTLTWNKSIKKHTINVLGGFTAQGGKSSTHGMQATQLPNESLGLSGLDEGITKPITATSSLWTMTSFLGRVNYNYQSKYLLTASFRADGSSKFVEENHWSYFPSAALSWRFSSENFMKNIQFLSDGKFRVSYGATGNNRVGDFAYLTTFGLPIASSYVFGNNYVNGIVPTALGNSDLRWETTKQTNIGLDLGFFNQRITLTADVYQKKTQDLLLYASLPNSTGFDKAFKNVGSVKNEGLELTLNTVNVKTESFTWNSSFNISFNKSEVLGLAENQESLQSAISWDQGWKSTSGYIAKVGMPLGLIYGYIWDGVYTYEDFDRTTSGGYILKDNVSTNGNTRDKIQPGDIKYRDLNGDLKADANDYTVIGRGLPVHFGGFNNNFTYKNIDLNVFFQWSYGNDVINANRLMFDGNSSGRMGMNQYATYADRWSKENPNSDIYRTKGYFGGGYSSNVVEDGSYLRLKTVSLGYNFSNHLLKRIKIKSLRTYVSAQNVFTWTKYSGLDPEVSAYNSALTPGFDFSTYPRARTISFGANLTF